METRSTQTSFLVGIVVLAVLLFAGLTWAVLRAPSEVISTDPVDESVTFQDVNDPSMGPADAKVVVHAYGDFECPACRSAEPPFQAAIRTYQDRVRVVWKDFPLSQIHPKARLGANAARCAQVQGKFWEYHDLLFTRQDEWVGASDGSMKLKELARSVPDLDGGTFDSCLDARAQDGWVATSQAEGFANNVDRTPTFFVNNKRVYGMSQSEWESVLQKALSED